MAKKKEKKEKKAGKRMRENKLRIVIITYCIFTISCVERHIKREVYLLTRFPYL